MNLKSVFLDTSFFIRLMNQVDPHHEHAKTYFKRFRDDEVVMATSTIVLAEYGVQGNISHLPLNGLRLLAFDINHARQSSIFAKEAFDARRKGAIETEHRVMIPNDTKLMAQAHIFQADYVVGRDNNFSTLIQFLQGEGLTSCQFLDITLPPNEFWGELF